VKIDGIQIDGFGVWSGLALEDLSEGLNVFFGPNEAGKTTLLEFVRAMFYGFTPERQRYLPPLHGGRPGGAIALAAPEGRFRLERHDDAPSPGGLPRAMLVAPDGARHGEGLLKTLLAGVDEPTFNNVFAVGLRELQHFGSLGDVEAAALLFDLSVGLDRVSLVDVLREVNVSRRRLWRDDGKPCEIQDLLARRSRLRGELVELDSLGDAYARAWDSRRRLDRELEDLEREKRTVEAQTHALEAAVAAAPKWRSRAAIDAELVALGVAGAVPAGAMHRLEQVSRRIMKYRRRLKELAARRRRAQREAEAVVVSEALLRHAARIEAMGQQEGWILMLTGRVGELAAEARANQERLDALRREVGLDTGPDAPVTPPGHSDAARLRRSGEDFERADHALAEARDAADTADAVAQSLRAELETALAARGERDLAEALERTGGLVAQLRRRGQLDERLDQMERHTVELERQVRDLLGRQILPASVMVGLGLGFAVGAAAMIAGLFMLASDAGSLGWALTLVGLAGVGVGGGGKVAVERAHARRLDACQKHLHMLRRQIEEARDERQRLTEALGGHGGAMAERLAEAESKLAAIESLVPLRTRLEAATAEAQSARARQTRAEEIHEAAQDRWREALASAGLPEGLTPRQVRRLRRSSDRLAELSERHRRTEGELTRCRQELDGVRSRLVALAGEAGVSASQGDPVEILRELVAQARRQEEGLQAREQLVHEAKRLGREIARGRAALRKAVRRRRRLLARFGVADADELRRRADEVAQAETLRHQRDALSADVRATLGGRLSEEALGEILDGASDADLEARWGELQKQLDALGERLRQQYEARGRLAEQLQTLAADRRGPTRRLELAVVEERLARAVRRWHVLAVTGHVLDEIKGRYERERQPAALQEASEHLRRLTNGRYPRVWTPLGEDSLRVDDARGQPLPVEALSRGTREQLFLALRLALVSAYAQRGARLPLVLDDVLVNYDGPQAKAAAEVLCAFARAGHQVFVFTCHDHIARLFRSLKIEPRVLPGRGEPGLVDLGDGEPADLSREPAEKRRRKSARPSQIPPARDENDTDDVDDADDVEDSQSIPEEIAAWEDVEVRDPDDDPSEESFDWLDEGEDPPAASEKRRSSSGRKKRGARKKRRSGRKKPKDIEAA